METQNYSGNVNSTSYISLIGSAISALCFFAPWVGCSGRTISGADIGGDFWVIFASSAISLLAFLFFKSQNNLTKAGLIIGISSVIGGGFLLYKYMKFQGGEFHNALEIKWGSVATLAGFVIAIIGISFLEDVKPFHSVAEAGNADDKFCSNCGTKYSPESAGEFCEECGTKR
ncbi:MAG: hypothetical protein ACM3RX_10015 [Methanococcaceae archaeon]